MWIISYLCSGYILSCFIEVLRDVRGRYNGQGVGPGSRVLC